MNDKPETAPGVAEAQRLFGEYQPEIVMTSGTVVLTTAEQRRVALRRAKHKQHRQNVQRSRANAVAGKPPRNRKGKGR